MLRETSINFRDFFRERFFRIDRKYVDISMSNVLSEMAVPMDVSKLPIKPDKDDIQFLQQFPSQYWIRALHQRYHDDLKDALKERHARRAPTEKRMKNLLVKALTTGNFRSLQGVVSDELFTRLQNQEYDHVAGNDALVEKAAAKLAELETEKQIPHATHSAQEEGLPPGYKKFVFKKSRNGNETVTIVAKPYINRLVHKLERNRGQEHHPDSGLHELGVTHGQYGYDLYGIEEGDGFHPHVTRGMQLPPKEEVEERMKDYMNHNAHGMYGKLPQGPDIVYKIVGEGRGVYRDNWSWRKIKTKLESEWNKKIATAEPMSLTLPDGSRVPPQGGFKETNVKRAVVAQLAMMDTIKMIEDGKIKGPPIPGIAPDGMPVRIKIVKGRKMIDAPPLYLPHKKTQVREQDASGQVKTVMHEVPMVNPMEYLRELGSEPDDHDAETGEMTIDPSELRGHQKDYVHVPHNDWKKTRGYLAGGALHTTHNTSGRMHIDPSDPEYQERKQEIEENMGMTGLDGDNKPSVKGDGDFFLDIVKGIWSCIRNACGGMTNHEVEIMRQNVPDLHQMVYQKMMMNLRDGRLDTPRGRQAFAKNVATSWAQQDLGKGGGTRRLRRLSQDARDASMDAETENKSGQAMSLRDSIQQRMKAKETGDSPLRQGEKIRPGAGRQAFPYNIDNLRTMIAEMDAEADKADSTRDHAIAMSRSDISEEIADLIGDAIADKAALTIKLEYLLTQLFLNAGSPPNEAEFQAKAKIQEYVAAGKGKSKQIVAAFKRDRTVQQILKQPDQPAQGQGQPKQLSMAEQDAVQRLQGILKQLPPDKLQDAATQQMIYNYIDDQAPDVQTALKDEADKAFGKVKPQPAATPTPTTVHPATAQAGGGDQAQQANTLIAQKQWLQLASNPYFLQKAPATHLASLIGKLEAAAQAMPQGMEREDHEFAAAHLRSILKKKQGRSGFDKIT